MKKVIVITGTSGAGKDALGSHLSKKYNLNVYKISDPLISIARQRNLELTRENLIAISGELSKDKGDGFLADLILEQIQNVGIITGPRQIGQIETIRKNSKSILISLDAHPKKRFERTRRLGRLKESSNIQEFIESEIKQNSPPGNNRLFEVMEQADYKLENNNDLIELYEKAEEILSKEGFI